jgi:hypothetical protein
LSRDMILPGSLPVLRLRMHPAFGQ